MKKKPFFLQVMTAMAAVLLFLVPRIPYAQKTQESPVKGFVFAKAGTPVAGATVKVKGKGGIVASNSDGSFQIIASDGAILIISNVGYETQEVVVAGNDLHIVLKPLVTEMDSLVVIGYGTVKKRDLTGAVSKMDAKAIANRPLARVETALQGQMAGVVVRTTTGEPGADMQIRVRGAASVNASSDPLYVVDGVPISTLSGINPSDIASIEVLKDAASAAIYGSRGSNGVVIVTTKRGKSGKPKISFNTNNGVQSLEKKMDILSSTEWMAFKIKSNDATYLRDAAAKGIPNAMISDANALRLSNLGIAAGSASAYNYINDERWFNYLSEDIKSSHTYIPNPGKVSLLNWQDEFYRKASIQDYNVNVAGGSENTQYLFSGGYMKQDGIATGTSYDRFSLRMNIESKINKYLAAGMTMAPTYVRRNGSGRVNGKDSQSQQVLVSTPVSDSGVGYMTNVQPNVKYNWASTPSSPTYIMSTNIRHDDILRMLGNAYVRITPLAGLKVELSASANYYGLEGSSYSYSSATSTWSLGEGASSSGGHNTEHKWNTLLQTLANYDHTFGRHGLSVMVGASSEKSAIGFTTNQTYNKPFPNDAIVYSFDGTLVPVGTSTVTQSTPNNLSSVFGRLSYNFDSRYLLSGSLRYDGGSVFGADNKWGTFPALSAGWVVSKENFFQHLNISWWNTLKLRASYGVTGNNAISYTAAYPSLTAVAYGGASGYSTNSLGNPNLGWEKTHSIDVAVDLGFFANRLQVSLDWYTKSTKDLLYQVPTLGASGFTTVWANLGNIDNHGLDIEVSTANLTGKFKWNTAFNVSFNQNTVKSLGVDNTPVYSGFDGSNSSNILTVGKPVNTFYMYDAIGVWKTQQEISDFSKAHGGKPVTFEGKTIVAGDIRYRDVNNDGIFTKEQDRDYLGSPTPTVVYGMTNTFSYKDFDLSVLLTAQTGGKIYGVIGRAFDRPGMGASSNALGRWRNAWWSESEPGDGTVPYLLSTTTGTTLDSRWLYSSDYLRVKNVTLGYKLPINPAIIPYAKLFLSVENLIKWDNYYGGYSPEAANTAASTSPGGQSAVGLDYSGYPIPRIVTLGVNLSF